MNKGIHLTSRLSKQTYSSLIAYFVAWEGLTFKEISDCEEKGEVSFWTKVKRISQFGNTEHNHNLYGAPRHRLPALFLCFYVWRRYFAADSCGFRGFHQDILIRKDGETWYVSAMQWQWFRAKEPLPAAADSPKIRKGNLNLCLFLVWQFNRYRMPVTTVHGNNGAQYT